MLLLLSLLGDHQRDPQRRLRRQDGLKQVFPLHSLGLYFWGALVTKELWRIIQQEQNYAKTLK